MFFQKIFISFIFIFLIALFSCNRNFDMAQAEAIVKMKEPTYKDKPIPPEILIELNKVIEKYKERVKTYADKAEQLQLLYKNIAQRYLDIAYFEQQIEAYLNGLEELKNPPSKADEKEYYDIAAVMLLQRKLYKEAYENIQKSLELAPDNTVLLYYAAYSAALLGKALRPESESEGLNWLEKAVKYYKLALEIDPDYIDSLYGISIILVYELNRAEEAIPYLLHIKEKNVANVDAMFVLASAYYAVGDYAKSIKEYEAIISTTAVDEKKKAASQNIEVIKEILANQ